MGTLKSVLGKSRNVLAQSAGAECLLVPVTEEAADLEEIETLNETAAFIYDCIDAEKSLHEIAVEVTQKFNVDYEVAARDLLIFADRMLELGLIEPVCETEIEVTNPNGKGEHIYVSPQVDSVRTLEASHAFYGALAPGCYGGTSQRCPCSA